jgi:hypothetical protein
MDNGTTHRPRPLRHAALGLAFCGTLAGVLIWTKLRLATDVPRSAYAVPERERGSTPKPSLTPTDPSAPAADTEEAPTSPKGDGPGSDG